MFEMFMRSANWKDLPAALCGIVDASGALRVVWGDVPLWGVHDFEFEEYTDSDGQDQKSKTHYTLCFARLDPPLRMALTLDPISAGSRFYDSSADLSVGDPRLSEHFKLRARDQNYARRLFTGSLLEVLIATKPLGVVVTDEQVSIRHRGWSTDLHALATSFEAIGRVVTALQWARRAMLSDWELEVIKVWPTHLQRLGMDFDPHALRGSGMVDGFFVRAVIGCDEAALTTTVTVQSPVPYARGLRVLRQSNGLLARCFRGQDIRVGDAAFDEAFVIKAESEPEARAALGPKVNSQMMALLARAKDLRVELDTLTLTSSTTGLPWLSAMIRACVDTALAMRAGR